MQQVNALEEWRRHIRLLRAWRIERAEWYRNAGPGDKIRRRNSIIRSARENPHYVDLAWEMVVCETLPYEPTPDEFSDVAIAFFTDRHYPGGWFQFLREA